MHIKFGNQSGQGTVIFLSTMPFILAIVALAAAIAITLDGHATNLFTCRTELLATQKQAAQSLNRLFSMNEIALRLHQNYEAAKARALANPEDPSAAAALQAQIALAVQFHQSQLLLIRTIKIQTQLSVGKLPAKMKQNLRRALPPVGKIKGPLIDISVDNPQLNLQVTALDPFTSQYRAPVDFSAQQKLTANWKFHIPLLLPQWLLKILGTTPTLAGQCSATIQKGIGNTSGTIKGGNKWTPILSAARSS